MAQEIKPVKLDSNGRIIPKGSNEPVATWRVTLGKKITGTSKQRKYFDTYRDAAKFIDDALEAQKHQSKEAFSISQKLRVEALECQKKLEPFGVSLSQAVDYHIRHAAPKGGLKICTPGMTQSMWG